MRITPETYLKLNTGHSQKLAYHLGSRSGFFAEYVNMLQGILFCLINGIEFQLYSKDTNFSTGRGWEEFFQPFCKEQTSPLHRCLNPRFPTPKFRFKLRKACAPALKFISRSDYLTYEVWDQLPPIPKRDQEIQLKALQREGSLLEIYRELVQMTWRLEPKIQQEIQAIFQAHKLPEHYLALHIRSGDKIKEARFYPLESYIEKLKSLSQTSNVLVLTDDYSNYKRLVENYPELHFYTLESPQQTGYQHRVNKRHSKTEKRADYIKFLAGIEASAQAEHFIGTYTSSIATFLRLRMPDHSCHGVDYDDWIQ